MSNPALDESAYHALADRTFKQLEDLLDNAGLDFETAGGILTIEMDDGSKIILNRQPPVQEIWLAARSGGFHFVWDGACWFSRRENAGLDELLRRCIVEQGGPALSPP
ncbi:MAG: iron donor protein CyaY [Betaproteobacteria bacterium]|nr:iron donor protein CyaY [Betaproteobacteria bacterium]